MAFLKTPRDTERVVPPLSSSNEVMDAIGQFLRAFREYRADLVGDQPKTVSPAVAEAFDEAFDRLTSLTAHLGNLRLHALDNLTAQEEERQRIAREIHDGPAQNIVWAIRQIEFAIGLSRTEKKEALEETLAGTLAGLRSMLTEVRAVISDLRPPELDHLGLKSALDRLARQTQERTGITTSVNWNCDPAFGEREEILLYRIIQEAVNNAAKHSGGSSIEIRAETNEIDERRELRFTIQDNGKGIKVPIGSAALVAAERFGLLSMQERAAILGGSITFSEIKPTGTALILLINKEL